MTTISARKEDHLDLAISGQVGFRNKTTLLECVQLVHDALPELDVDAIDLGVSVFGKRLKAPVIIAAMTGGTARAKNINEQLAALAEKLGYGFGLGSQRAMLENPACLETFAMRPHAPNTLVLGNIGGVQARRASAQSLEQMVADVQADALCIHLNPAMEVVQKEGDRDFRGILDAIGQLVETLTVPVVVKETGCGLSANVARRLRSVGVQHVDTSGAGGTSWVAVEAQRATGPHQATGEAFWDWGIPTAASLVQIAPYEFETVIATGGIASGVDAARALALGASAVGIARPVLQALERGGAPAAEAYLLGVERQLRTACLLSGAPNAQSLRHQPKIIHGPLRDWLPETNRGQVPAR